MEGQKRRVRLELRDTTRQLTDMIVWIDPITNLCNGLQGGCVVEGRVNQSPLLYLVMSGVSHMTFVSDVLAAELNLECHPFVNILDPAGFTALSCPDVSKAKVVRQITVTLGTTSVTFGPILVLPGESPDKTRHVQLGADFIRLVDGTTYTNHGGMLHKTTSEMKQTIESEKEGKETDGCPIASTVCPPNAVLFMCLNCNRGFWTAGDACCSIPCSYAVQGRWEAMLKTFEPKIIRGVASTPPEKIISGIPTDGNGATSKVMPLEKGKKAYTVKISKYLLSTCMSDAVSDGVISFLSPTEGSCAVNISVNNRNEIAYLSNLSDVSFISLQLANELGLNLTPLKKSTGFRTPSSVEDKLSTARTVTISIVDDFGKSESVTFGPVIVLEKAHRRLQLGKDFLVAADACIYVNACFGLVKFVSADGNVEERYKRGGSVISRATGAEKLRIRQSSKSPIDARIFHVKENNVYMGLIFAPENQPPSECSVCKISFWGLSNCKACLAAGTKVVYCSHECQRTDWPRHKKVCAKFAAVGES